MLTNTQSSDDPRFPQGESPTPQGRHQHTILPNFPENCMKSKDSGQPMGEASLRQPLSANGYNLR